MSLRSKRQLSALLASLAALLGLRQFLRAPPEAAAAAAARPRCTSFSYVPFAAPWGAALRGTRLAAGSSRSSAALRIAAARSARLAAAPSDGAGVDAAGIGGPVLAPGSEGTDWWDARNSASPVVLPPGPGESRWRMWYYGREGTTWSGDVEAFLPTGRIGTAISDDGISWKRLRGPLSGGACFDPSVDEDAFDSVHVGVGDVVRLPNGTLWMYYFGGGRDCTGAGRVGLRMQVGLAASEDGGLTWSRCNGGQPVLRSGDSGSFDALFVAWPRVLAPSATGSVPGIPAAKWYMSYHTAAFGPSGITWSAGAALSGDGVHWEKTIGPVLLGGEAGSWDQQGVGVRSVAPTGSGGLAMLYEAVDAAGVHAIGLAESDDGVAWRKASVAGRAAPGGPVLERGSCSWDDRVVGTPYVVAPTRLGENWKLYYIGEAEGKPGLSVGLAESDGCDLTRWWKLGSNPMDRGTRPAEGVRSRGWDVRAGEKSQAVERAAPETFSRGGFDLAD